LKSRFFFEIAYNGVAHSGWQKQPNAPSIQEDIETLLSKLYQEDIRIMGCGRTDAGVHASQYFFHADIEDSIQKEKLLYKLNRMSGDHLAFFDVLKVVDDAHTRFQATQRSYVYQLTTNKDPFSTSFYLGDSRKFDLSKLNQAAQVLLDYNAFYPFCKTHADVKTYKCYLTKSEWIKTNKASYEYHVSANRFLRGMVRLIVGMCLNYMNDLITIDEIKVALKKQERLPKDLSVPPTGLYLNEVKYPQEVFNREHKLT